jgi:hypothetical protein
MLTATNPLIVEQPPLTVILDTSRVLQEFHWAITAVSRDYEFYPEEIILDIFECLAFKDTAIQNLKRYIERYRREFQLSEFTDHQIAAFGESVRILGFAIYDALVILRLYGWDQYLYYRFMGRTFEGDIMLEYYATDNDE